MKNKFYITTPIYYVNAEPHIGHTYTTVAADVLARYHRLLGEDVFFATGTDEHGAKIEQKAATAGKDPQEFTNQVSAKFQMAWDEFDISHNRFIRTTEPDHIKAVQNALQYMYDKGDIYKDKYEGLYCTGCEQFKNEKDLVNGKCPDHQTVPEKMSEETYMFRMSKYADKLFSLIKSDKLKIRPLARKNEILSFYHDGLKDVSFSRRNVKWGIPLPWDKSHTAYVWSDAFLNYLTILSWTGRGPKLNSKAKEFWPADVQLMSKDILRVHATIWPAMLLSLGLPTPKSIFVHGFFLIDGAKMSKSLGNVISPDDLLGRYGVDGARYLLMSATTFGHDGDIGFAAFDEKFNADLANGLGNLVARVVAMTLKLIKSGGELKKKESFLNWKKIINEYQENMAAIALDAALKTLTNAARATDKYITDTTPFKIIGKDNDKAGEILYQCLENIRLITLLIWPFMPGTAEKIWQNLGQQPATVLSQKLTKNIINKHINISGDLIKPKPPFPRLSNI